MCDVKYDVDLKPEDKIIKFRGRLGELVCAIEILKSAVHNEFEVVEISHVDGLLEIVYERLQQDVKLLDDFMDDYSRQISEISL